MSSAHRLLAAAAALFLLLGGSVANAEDKVIAKVNGKTITEADMRLAEAEIGSDLGSLPPATRRRVLVEFLIENQLFADAAEGQKLASGAAFNERMQYWRRRSLRDSYVLPATISERERVSLRATVVLYLDTDGRVLRYAFETHSGNGAFDAALERAIRAARIPPPPPELRQKYRNEGLGVVYRP